MDIKRPRRLNLNAPLISTRRSSAIGDQDDPFRPNTDHILTNSSSRVPFCWEQAAGLPKIKQIRDGNDEFAETPRPKPPPGRWRRQKDQLIGDENGDVLSLTEAIDIAEKAEAEAEHFPVSGEVNSENGLAAPLPNFMIERFLKDATALAAGSCALSKNKKLSFDSSEAAYPSDAVVPPKGCGLEQLLPWRVKHRVCGVKSPVKQTAAVLLPASNFCSVKMSKDSEMKKGDVNKKD